MNHIQKYELAQLRSSALVYISGDTFDQDYTIETLKYIEKRMRT